MNSFSLTTRYEGSPGLAASMKRLPPWLLLWLIAWLAIARLPVPAGSMTIEMHAQVPHVTLAKLYFDRGSGIVEQDSATAWIHPGPNQLQFALPEGRHVLFRLDPHKGSGPVRIKAIRLSPDRKAPASALPLDGLAIGDQIAAITPTPDGALVQPVASATMPQLLLSPSGPFVVPPASRSGAASAASAAVFVLALSAFWYGARRSRMTVRHFVALGLAAVFLLAWTMAMLSPRLPIHPDEIAHVWAFQHFSDRFLPAAADDPSMLRTVSVYGFSYLFELDVVYALAARVVGPFSAWFPDDYAASRAFNLLLLAVLLVAATVNRRWAICMAVVLISPQIWYIFSYFNADALPFALALVCAACVADDKGALNRFLGSGGRPGLGLLVFVMAAGLLLVSKRNYLPMLPLFWLWLAIRHLSVGWRSAAALVIGLGLLGAAVHLHGAPAEMAAGAVRILLLAGAALILAAAVVLLRGWLRDRPQRAAFLRLALIIGATFLVAAPRAAVDMVLNGGPAQKAETLERIAEAHAGHGFKPSQLREDYAYPGRGLIQRGFRLDEVLFAPHHWLHTSLVSAYGVYGYFVAFTPLSVILLLQLTTLALFLVGAGALVAQEQRRRALAYLVVVFGGLLLVGLNSLMHSWVFDLQPQGRYLLPGAALLSLLLGTAADRLPRIAVTGLFLAGFLLSCLSFVFVGLPALSAKG